MKHNNLPGRWLLLSGAGLLLARISFFGLSPFVPAYVTLLFYFSCNFTFKGAGEKRYRGILFCGILMGIVTRFSIITTVRYALTVFFCAGSVVLFRKREKNIPVLVIALCALAGAMLGAAFSSVLFGSFERNGLLWGAEAVFSFFMVFLFESGLRYFLCVPEGETGDMSESAVQRYKRKRLGYEELLSLMLILSLVLMGCPKIMPYGIDLIFSLRFFFILLSAYIYGVGAGGISGMVMGFLLIAEKFMGNGAFTGLLSFENNNGQILLLCLCGIMAGIGREFSKLMSVLGFMVTGTVFYYLGNNNVVTPFHLLEICIAAVVFLLIPSRWLSPDFGMEEIGGKNVQGSKKSYRECFQGIIKDKIKGYSKAFTRLSKSFLSLSEESQEIGFPDAVALVDGVSGKIC